MEWKRMLSTIPPLVLITLVIATSPSSYAFEGNESVTIRFVNSTPVIDGIVTTPEEWSKAAIFLIDGGDVQVRAMHNNQLLSLIVSFNADMTNNAGDSVLICIDSRNDGGSAWKSDDYCFGLIVTDTRFLSWLFFIGKGTGNEFSLLANPQITTGASSGVSFSNGGFSGRDHRVYEMSIPIDSLRSDAESYGLSIYVYDADNGTTKFWPEKAVPASHGCFSSGQQSAPPPDIKYCPSLPNAWGNLVSTNKIPEFPFPVAMITLAGMMPLVLIIMRRKTSLETRWHERPSIL